MSVLTTRGKIVVGGLFLLLLLSTAFASLTATIMIHRNHELDSQKAILMKKCELLQEKNDELIHTAEQLQVRVKQLENGEIK